MITNLDTPNDSKPNAFHDCAYASVADAWQHGLNGQYWRHGITINQGLGWSVSEDVATKRLNYIRIHLLKEIFGNNFRRKGAEIRFLRFKQGSRESLDQHFHALMAIEGDHNWSDQQIANAIDEIEHNRTKKRWEKDAHVDWDWRNGNRFHSYVSRQAAFDADSVLVM